MKKILWLCAILLCLGALLVACSGKGNGQEQTTEAETLPPSNPDAFDLTDCLVTRPAKGSDLFREAGSTLATALYQKTGKVILAKDDFVLSEGGPEFLIGITNRAESSQVYGTISNDPYAFAISRVNNKMVIVGTTLEMTLTGVQYFVDTVLPETVSVDGKLNIPLDYSYVRRTTGTEFVKNGKAEFDIVTANDLKNALKASCATLQTAVSEITTNRPRITADSLTSAEGHDSSDKEVLVGATYYPESQELMAKIGYAQYGVAVKGNKILILGYSTDAINNAVELLDGILKRNQNGKSIVLPDGMLIIKKATSVKMDIPAFPAVIQQLIEVEGDAHMAYIPGTTEAQFNEYATLLEGAGLTRYADNTIGTSKFYTYVADKKTVNVGWDPTNNTVRLICDNYNNRPLTAETNEYAERCDTLLTQVGLTYLKADTGMSYTMRLADGRFVVIDGGCKDFDDVQQLYDIIKSQHVGEGEPVIAAWFLTHAHSDHYENFLAFANAYQSSVKIETVVYNLPTTYFHSGLAAAAPAIDTQIYAIPGVKAIYARTGQVFHIADAQFEIMFTPEDFYPGAVGGDENDSSVVFKITCEGQSILIFGDSAYNAAKQLLRRYGETDALKSDIMQVAHHGYDGTDALYRLVDPTIVLWPCPDHWFHEAQRWDATDIEGSKPNRWIFNKYLVTSPNVTEIFNSGHGTTVLKLPYTSPANGNPTQNVFRPGEVIYSDDFESIKSLYETGWWAINSLVEKYTVANLEIVKRGSNQGILMTGTDNSVLGIVRPDLLKNTKKFTLEINLQIDDLGDGFGIWYNDNRPIESKNRCLYQLTRKGAMTVKLEVDLEAGTTDVYFNNVHQTTIQNASNNAGGIYFWSAGAKVFIGSVKLTAGIQ